MTYPAAVAEKILNQLSINSPAALQRLEDIAWARGAEVKYGPLSSAEGRLVVNRGKGIITISSTVSSPQRKRFSIAHELGHFEMHRQRSSLFLCSIDDINDGAVKNAVNKMEREANEFASAFLLPERIFEPLCDEVDPSLDRIAELADTFNTSLAATALRFIRFTQEPVAVVYTVDQYINWVRRSAQLEELGLFIEWRRQLHSTSMAFRQWKRQHHVRADIWFDDGNFHDDARIMEHSWPMPRQNAVLTLLWLDEDITGEDDLTW